VDQTVIDERFQHRAVEGRKRAQRRLAPRLRRRAVLRLCQQLGQGRTGSDLFYEAARRVVHDLHNMEELVRPDCRRGKLFQRFTFLEQVELPIDELPKTRRDWR
jgi:hypothetical protein